jgi:hypothetical protein
LSHLREKLANEFVIKMQGKEYVENEEDKDSLEHIPNQIKIINANYMELCHVIGKEEDPCLSLARFVGRAFVTFEYQHYRDYFLRECDKNSAFLTFNRDRNAKVSLAPKPNDIFWYNMKEDEDFRLKQTIYSYVIMLLALIFLLGGLIALNIWR